MKKAARQSRSLTPDYPDAAEATLRQPELAESLIAWFQREGRDLPWRRRTDAYAVTVSEFMLQQTQVVTVIPYWERWMTRFPDWQALATASEQAVLSQWEGLGYYTRARNLHRLAQVVNAEYGGVLPRDPARIRELPGIGEYSAGAVASFAFNLPAPAVDANVARVLVRWLDWTAPIDRPAVQARLRELATTLIPEGAARRFNGAVMELGATICLPRRPLCMVCPVQRFCAAGEPERLPVKSPRRRTVHLIERAWLVRKAGKIALTKVDRGRRWKGLWQLPPCEEGRGEPMATERFPYTHHQIRLEVYPGEPEHLHGEECWVAESELPDYPIPAPHRRVLMRLLA